MSTHSRTFGTPLRLLMVGLLCSSAAVLCGNSACDGVGGYDPPEPDLGLDMNVEQDMQVTPPEEDMMPSPEDMGEDMATPEVDMPPDMTEAMGCDRTSDCETGQENVIASCNSLKVCSYECSSDGWAVTDGEDISVDGCTCTVQEEICDNRDNDCDTEIDEDLFKACENQEGVCGGANRVCRGVASDFAQECEEIDYKEHSVDYTSNVLEDFQCDGLDNDCDGEVDDVCCKMFPMRAGNAHIIATGFSATGYASFLSKSQNRANQTYSSNETIITIKTEDIKDTPQDITPNAENSSFSTQPACQRTFYIETTTLETSENSYHFIEPCIADSNPIDYKLMLSHISMNAPLDSKDIEDTHQRLDWTIFEDSIDDSVREGRRTYDIASNSNAVFISAWNYDTNTEKASLVWCKLNPHSSTCAVEDRAPSRDDTNDPLKVSVAVSPAGKVVIATVLFENNPLHDIISVYEVDPSGTYKKTHNITLPSTVGGSRETVDLEVKWQNDDDIVISHFSKHPEANRYQIYTGLYSTQSETLKQSIDIPAVDGELDGRREIALDVDSNRTLLIAMYAQKIITLTLDQQFNITKQEHIVTLQNTESGKLRANSNEQLVQIQWIEELSSASNNTAFSFFLSKEGVPICRFEPKIPTMMP